MDLPPLWCVSASAYSALYARTMRSRTSLTMGWINLWRIIVFFLHLTFQEILYIAWKTKIWYHIVASSNAWYWLANHFFLILFKIFLEKFEKNLCSQKVEKTTPKSCILKSWLINIEWELCKLSFQNRPFLGVAILGLFGFQVKSGSLHLCYSLLAYAPSEIISTHCAPGRGYRPISAITSCSNECRWFTVLSTTWGLYVLKLYHHMYPYSLYYCSYGSFRSFH